MFGAISNLPQKNFATFVRDENKGGFRCLLYTSQRQARFLAFAGPGLGVVSRYLAKSAIFMASKKHQARDNQTLR